MRKFISLLVIFLCLFGYTSTPDFVFADDNQDAFVENEDDLDFMDEFADEEDGNITKVYDPLYYWNKSMFHFNDKLYFWVIKPAAKGYRAVTPSLFRTGVKNFFNNLTTPVRFINSLLQGKSEQAGVELGRFMVNTVVGVLGFGNPAENQPDLKTPPDEDLGQTFGVYGIGNGFYIVWPFLGPSSLRDSIGLFSDNFLSPVNYVDPMSASMAIEGFEMINSISFRLGDYESLKEAALEPYEAFRDAYIQHRIQKIKN